MSIANELTNLRNYLNDAYDSVDTKGGIVPAQKTMANLPDAIESIPSGGSSEVESVTITNKATFEAGFTLPANGTYLEEDLAVTVAPRTAPQLYTVISSDETAVKPVYNNGAYKLRILKAGTVTIRVQDYSGLKSDSVSFTVVAVPTAFSISRKLPVFCEKGSTFQLGLSFTPLSASGNAVTFISSDTSVATVNSTGLVTFVDEGSVTITATVDDYSTFSATTTGVVVEDTSDPDFDTLSEMIQAGTAESSFAVGLEIAMSYSENGGTTVYDNPLVVMGFRDVELADGTTKKGMVVMPKYVTATSRRYSKAIAVTNLTASSGETVAQEGYYYYDSSNNPLNYETGDPLDFNTYPTIRKTDRNVTSAQKLSALISYGDRRWAYSDAREWLNNVYIGYWGSAFTSHIAEGKVVTVDDKYSWEGEVRTSYDKFFLPSNVELLAGVVNSASYTQDQVDNEGEALQYYIDIAGTSTPSFNATAQNNARSKKGVNATTANKSYWTRSVYSSDNSYEWYVDTSGDVGSNAAYNTSPLAPLAVLI